MLCQECGTGINVHPEANLMSGGPRLRPCHSHGAAPRMGGGTIVICRQHYTLPAHEYTVRYTVIFLVLD